MVTDQWPIHRVNEIVGIIAEEEAGIHRLSLRSDGIVSMICDPELLARQDVPEYVRIAARQPGNLIRREERDALRRLFDKADALEAS